MLLLSLSNAITSYGDRYPVILTSSCYNEDVICTLKAAGRTAAEDSMTEESNSRST